MWSPHSTDQVASRIDDPGDERQVRVPRLDEHREPVAPQQHGDDGADHDDTGRSGAAVADPERDADPGHLAA